MNVYLHIIILVLSIVVFFALGTLIGFYANSNLEYKKHFIFYQKHLFEKNEQIILRQNIKLDGYFHRNNYRRIVVYGLGMYYKNFLDTITISCFKQIYFADKSANSFHINGEKIYTPEELLSQDFYDVIVITSHNHSKEIENELRTLGIQKDIVTYKNLIMNASKERSMPS